METKILAISTNRRPREGAIIQRNFRATSYSITLGRHLAINCRVLDRPLYTSTVGQLRCLKRYTFVELSETLADDIPGIKQGFN